MAIIRRNERSVAPARNDWDPFQLMDQMLRWDPFRTGFDPFAQMSALTGDARGFVPSFDVKETKEAFVFKADLPGVKQDDLDLSLSGNLLTISGKREAEVREKDESWFAVERTHGSFTRSFTLPEAADGDHVRAELKEGVLTLVLPKKPELQPRKIAVQASGGTATGKA